jgi:hypothetical protein
LHFTSSSVSLRRPRRQPVKYSSEAVTTWALQVQFLLQIIINRVSLLLTDSRKAMRLKIGVAVLITAVNISVYCIWVPARLQISKRYEYINDRWDRCEKVIYLCVDGTLNWYFIHIVKKKLVDQGCKRFSEYPLLLKQLQMCRRFYMPALFFRALFPIFLLAGFDYKWLS